MMTYRNMHASLQDRVEDLFQRMSLEEKVAQLTCVMASTVPLDALVKTLPYGIGNIAALNVALTGDNRKDRDRIVAIQRYLIEDTRLGIPAWFHSEGLAGVQIPSATAFSQSLGLAATWDPSLAEQAGRVVSRQAHSFGIQTIHSPLFDLARDMRWGRVGETYGEDPYLVAAMGVAFVKGIQADGKTMATAKHFITYGNAEGGRNGGDVQVGERRLLDTFAFPFEAAIHDGGVLAVMNAYGSLNDEPISTSKRYLTDLLRNKLGFDGLVLADYGSIYRASGRYHTAADPMQAGIQALKAGIDVEQPNDACYRHLVRAVNEGQIDIEYIDRSVRRVLAMKFHLGLFEAPYSTGDFESEIARESNRDLALEIAEKSLVLLSNKNHILPLDGKTRIALVGPGADDSSLFFGGYSAVGTAQVTSSDTDRSEEDAYMKNAYAAVTGEYRESFIKQSGIQLDPIPTPEQRRQVMELLRAGMKRAVKTYQTTADFIHRFHPECKTIREEWNDTKGSMAIDYEKGCEIRHAIPGGIDRAVALANAHDVVVAIIGGKESMRAEDATCGENRDNTEIDLEPCQRALIQALVSTGKPVVAVLLDGRPLSSPLLQVGCAAIVYAWMPGQEGARAIVRTLTGKHNPAGRLPVTIVKHVGQLPYRHDRLPLFGDDVWSEYLNNYDNEPLYRFGHGLSYTSFAYHDLTHDTEVTTEGVLHASFRVTNTGDVAGDEVVQLYADSVLSDTVRPLNRLIGFLRLKLAPKETKIVRFKMDMRMQAYHDTDMRLAVEPGEIDLAIGASSGDIRLKGRIRIAGKKRFVERKVFHTDVTTE